MKRVSGPCGLPTAKGPFRKWSIFLSDPVETHLTIKYPPAESDQGVMKRMAGRILLDPANHRIIVEPRSGIEPSDEAFLVRAARENRDWKDFDLGATPEMLAGLVNPIEIVESFGPSEHVVRCFELGCDTFMGWHKAKRNREGAIELDENHVGSDLSNEYYRARLMLVRGKWVLDIGAKLAMRDDPTAGAQSFAQAVLLLADAAVERNQALHDVSI